MSGTRCYLRGCNGSMEGQMLACPPHWTLLPEGLRLQLVEAWDQLEAQRRVGNPRRATRERWRLLVHTADAEWVRVRRQLEQATGRRVGYSGAQWLRAVLGLARPALAEAEAEAEA